MFRVGQRNFGIGIQGIEFCVPSKHSDDSQSKNSHAVADSGKSA